MSSNIPQWWVIGRDSRVLAGPFTVKADAEYARDDEIGKAADAAGRADGDPDYAAAAYGVRRPDGAFERRQSPAEKAWEAFLADQLSRLSDGWGGRLTGQMPRDDLAVEVATALVESGFDIHDCAAKDARGGVCLTPSDRNRGVIVTWTQHDRQAIDHVRGYDRYAAVQETMNYALVDALTALGYEVVPLAVGTSSAHVVTGKRDRAAELARRQEVVERLAPVAAVEMCAHQGAVDIVSLLGPADSNEGVPANDGREIGAAEGTCPDCGARVVTVNIYDPAKPWGDRGHGGTDRSTNWTPWLSAGGTVVKAASDNADGM